MPDLSKIKMPSGTTYDLKDATARADIASIRATITGAMSFRGVTTTSISDGSTTATLTIGGSSYTFTTDDAGSVVIYGEREYIWNGSKWQEFGSSGSLGPLAFKQPGEQFATITTGGSVGTVSVAGSSTTFTGSYQPSGVISISSGTTGTSNYTPTGSVSAPTISVATNGAGATTSIVNPVKQVVAKDVVAADPATGLSTGQTEITYYSVDSTTETLTLYKFGKVLGDSIDDSTTVTVKTGDASYVATAPTFTGDDTVLSATFTGDSTSNNISVSGTPNVSVTQQPTFTGATVNIYVPTA